MRESEDVGRYRLLERIAIGATAEVFHAVRVADDHRVVLKILRREHAGDPRFRRLLEEEAKLARELDHPCIVRLLDSGDAGGRTFLVLERIEGRDLRALAGTQKKIDPALAAYITARVAAALAYVHTRLDADGRALGLVHRDVTPENILLSSAGDVKLTDFGIARRTPHDTLDDAPVGKIDHLSPEQATPGAEVTPKSDIFALGTVLYELVFGAAPFAALSEEESLERLKSGTLAIDLSHPLGAILERCLAHQPADRYATAADLYRALEAHLELSGKAPAREDIARFVLERSPPPLPQPEKAIDRVALDLLGAPPPREPSRPSTALIPAQVPVEEPVEPAPPPPPPTARVEIPRAIPFSRSLGAHAATAIITALLTWNIAVATMRNDEPITEPLLEIPAGALAENDPLPPRSFSIEELDQLELSANVEPRPHMRTMLRPESRPSYGSLSITSSQPARVYLDGDLAGTTPFNKSKLATGNHRVALKTPEGKLLRTYLVYVKKGEQTLVKFDAKGGAE